MVRIEINNKNYAELPWLAAKLGVKSVKAVELFFDLKGEIKFEASKPFLYEILDQEESFFTVIKNLPYCVLGVSCVDHIDNSDCQNGKKATKCRECRFTKVCPGFPLGYLKKYGAKELQPIPDRPVEVMIEIEPNCNCKCEFCFNKISFAKNGRNIRRVPYAVVKKIIDNIKKAGINSVRFTGGEPLLYPGILELLLYAKRKKLEVRLNTNGLLIDKAVAVKMSGLVDNVLIPIDSCTDAQESKITGVKNSLSKKIAAIKNLKKAGVPVVRVGTVATKNSIRRFREIYGLMKGLRIDEWELYRPVSIRPGISASDIESLVAKIIQARREKRLAITIANAIPFCAIKNLNKLNAVSTGALYDEGHSRLVIDARGFCKPHYFLDENIGSADEILPAWNHPFMKKIRDLQFVPDKCKKCLFVLKCRGGSRFAARSRSGRWQAPDPLANYKNLNNFNKSLK